MTTIQKTVRIPADHHLKLEIDLPDDTPVGGEAKVIIMVPTASSAQNKTDQDVLLSLAGKLAGSPAFPRDAVELQREWRDEWD